MESEVLKKEEELRKENKMIELRTREFRLKLEDLKKTQLEELQMQPLEAQDLNLPKSVDEMGPKGMIHFYKAKIKALQEEYSKVQEQHKNKSDEIKKIQKVLETTSEEKEKWFLQYNAEKNSNSKFEKQMAALNSKLLLKERENVNLKKEVDQLKSNLRSSSEEVNTLENRIKRLVQENDKQKGTMNDLKQRERETKQTYQNDVKELTANVKQLQKQKKEILEGFQLQTKLINSLKKQKILWESSKALEITEKDFLKLLNSKLN